MIGSESESDEGQKEEEGGSESGSIGGGCLFVRDRVVIVDRVCSDCWGGDVREGGGGEEEEEDDKEEEEEEDEEDDEEGEDNVEGKLEEIRSIGGFRRDFGRDWVEDRGEGAEE